MENLEQRLVLATFSVNPGDVSNTGSGGTGGLVWAINQANLAGGSNTIDLAAGSTYSLTAADNHWYGPNGLPPIDSDITIVGNGATIERSTGTPDFRLFYVSGGEELAAGSLDLENLTLANGVAQGGAGGAGGGGGMGAGGAVFNQGTLLLSGVTLTNNRAIGGSAAPSGQGGGGGIGGDQQGVGGGGFGGSFSTTLGGHSGAGDSNGAGGGGGGFLTGASGGAASGNNGGAGGGLGGFGGAGGTTTGASGGAAGDGGGGGGTSAGTGTGPAGGAFGFGGGFAGDAGGGGGVGGGGGAGVANGGGGGGGFGGGGGGGGLRGGVGGGGGFGGGGGGPVGAGGFAGGVGGGDLTSGGGGGGLGGAIFTMGAFSSGIAEGAVTIVNSTFANNSAAGGPGGGSASGGGSGFGGAIFNLDGSLTFINDTLAHNTVTGGNGGGGGATGPADGGAIYNLAYGNRIDTGAAVTATINLNNSILADNTGGADLASKAINGAHANSATVTGTSNLITLSDVTSLAGGVATVGAEPNLPNLANNGGPTETIAITAASPAYNAGSSSVAGLPATDQRGAGFPRINFGAVDLGAFEVQTSVSLSAAQSPFAENGGTATITATLDGTSNQNVTVPLTFGGSAVQGVDYSASASSITIAAGHTSGSITLTGLSNTSFGTSSKTVIVGEGSVTNSAAGSPATVTATIDPAVSLPAASLTSAIFGNTYSFQITASGGDGGPYTYSITAGALPTGLVLDTASGKISGSATQGGNFSFTVQAGETAQPSFPPATQTYTLEVLPRVSLSDSGSPLAENGGTATVTAALNGVSNEDVTVPLTFGGSAVSNSDYSSSATNITIAAGHLSGSITLTGLGNSGFGATSKTVVVGLGSLNHAVSGSPSSVTVTIDPAVSLPATTLSDADLGSAYSASIVAAGGDGGPYTYSIAAGALPSGLVLDTATGKISGTPTQAGGFSFTVRASDSNQPLFPPASQSYTLEVLPSVSLSESGSPFAENGGKATITATLSGNSNQDVTVPFTFGGGAAQDIDYFASSTTIVIAADHTSGSITLTGLNNSGFGAMPKTVVVGLGSLTHAVSGSPSSVTVTIDPAVSLPATSLSDAVLGSAYRASIVASGGDGGPYSYAITAGALPGGLSLDTATGTISGTATQGGSFSFILQASDSAQPSFPPASQAYTLEVLPTVSLSIGGSPLAENGGTATVTATLNGVSNQDVIVPLTFGGSAVQNVDYSASATGITIAAGHTSGSITLTGLGNSRFGTAPQTVIISLGTLSHAAPGSANSVTATLQAPPVPSTTSFIQSVYLHLLDRPADADALKYWKQVLDTAGNTATGRMQVVAEIEASPEYLFDEVNGLYTKYLGRSAAGDSGAQFWVGQLMGGSSFEEVAALIAGSPEFVQKQTDGSIGSWLKAFYPDALNRPVDSGAVQHWSALFAAGASRAQIAEDIFTAPPQPGQSANEYRLALVDAYYAQLLNRSAEADASSRGWAALLQQGITDQAVIAEIMASQEFFNDSV